MNSCQKMACLTDLGFLTNTTGRGRPDLGWLTSRQTDKRCESQSSANDFE